MYYVGKVEVGQGNEKQEESTNSTLDRLRFQLSVVQIAGLHCIYIKGD